MRDLTGENADKNAPRKRWGVNSSQGGMDSPAGYLRQGMVVFIVRLALGCGGLPDDPLRGFESINERD